MAQVIDRKDVIIKLQDDEEYYNGIGRKYLSNSDIGTLLKNPKDFGRKREDSKVIGFSPTPAMVRTFVYGG